MKNNSLNLGQFLEKCYVVQMKNMSLYLCNDHNVLTTYVRISKNRIFLLNLNIYKLNCFKVIVGDESTI